MRVFLLSQPGRALAMLLKLSTGEHLCVGFYAHVSFLQSPSNSSCVCRCAYVCECVCVCVCMCECMCECECVCVCEYVSVCG